MVGTMTEHIESAVAASIVAKYYPDNTPLRTILVTHSQSVARMAMDVARRHPELAADETFLYEAAILHDIGIFLCNAPGICCTGMAFWGQNCFEPKAFLAMHAWQSDTPVRASLSRPSGSKDFRFRFATTRPKPSRSKSFATPTNSSPKRTWSVNAPRSKCCRVWPNSVRKVWRGCSSGCPFSVKILLAEAK